MKHLIAATLLAAALAAHASPESSRREKVSELFVLCANKALAGDFGKLADWQRKGYEAGLCRHRVKMCFLTQYYPQENKAFRRKKDGGNCCRWWDAGCSERVIAANRLPAYSFVWIARPAMMRQVLDTGAAYNDRVARADPAEWVTFPGGGAWGKGADLWADLWVPRPGWRGLDTMTCNVVTIPAVRE